MNTHVPTSLAWRTPNHGRTGRWHCAHLLGSHNCGETTGSLSLHPIHPVECAHGSLFTSVPDDILGTPRTVLILLFRLLHLRGREHVLGTMGFGSWRPTVAHRWRSWAINVEPLSIYDDAS